MQRSIAFASERDALRELKPVEREALSLSRRNLCLSLGACVGFVFASFVPESVWTFARTTLLVA